MVKLIENQTKNCCECSKKITVKYNYPLKRYSQKNNWYYWTEKEENKDKYICDACLLNLYSNNKRKYQQSIVNPGKRKIMTSHIYTLRNKNL